MPGSSDPRSAAFQADLLNALGVEPGLESALRDGTEATAELLSFHAGWVAHTGPRLYLTWTSACLSEPLPDGPGCPSCGRATYGWAHPSVLYPEYRRRLLVCPHDGVIADLAPGWTITVARVSAKRERAGTAFTFRATTTAGVTAVAVVEYHGEPGASGRPVTGSDDICATVRVPAVMASGVYRICLVMAAANDAAYLRLPVALT